MEDKYQEAASRVHGRFIIVGLAVIILLEIMGFTMEEHWYLECTVYAGVQFHINLPSWFIHILCYVCYLQ